MEQYLLVFMWLCAYISTESMFTIYSVSYLICRNEWNYGATILGDECVSNAVYIDSFNINSKANPTIKTNSCEIIFQHIMSNEVMDLAVRNS